MTKTTTSSTLTYSNLNTGLYLVVADNLVIDGKTYTYLPYLILFLYHKVLSMMYLLIL